MAGGDVADWWWYTSQSLHEISRLLIKNRYVVVDSFLNEKEASGIADEIKQAYVNGMLSSNGIIGGGVRGKDEAFVDSGIRGDVFGLFDGCETEWPGGYSSTSS